MIVWGPFSIFLDFIRSDFVKQESITIFSTWKVLLKLSVTFVTAWA